MLVTVLHSITGTQVQALSRNIDAILSPDRDFDDIPGLRRIDPADTAAPATLISA
jgi:hypothetical protein